MKKLYETPKALFASMNVEDVIATSNGLTYNRTQNALLDGRDSHSFGSFFADPS